MAANISQKRAVARTRRHFRLRKKVVGSAERPRLVVTRSSRHIGVQVVDDSVGRTLAAASTLEADLRTGDGDKTAKARKVGELIGPVFTSSLERAVATGEASRIGNDPLNLFWFAHHTVLAAALAKLPAVPCLTYGNAADLERQLCEFILRGIGLTEAAIASHLDRDPSQAPGQSVTAEGT